MITATYFGEITELDSRAVWYSDEEDEDEDSDDGLRVSSKVKSPEPQTHETFRSNIQLNYTTVTPHVNLKFTTCILSTSSSAQFKNFKPSNSSVVLGYLDTVGKVFAVSPNFETNEQLPEYWLWLLVDSTSSLINGHKSSYFVEVLREKLQAIFNINNCRPLTPPSIIKNQIESAFFEQLTLEMRQAIIVCLPNPKNFWFDHTKNWPMIPHQIIEHRLNDDNLDKTLIFT